MFGLSTLGLPAPRPQVSIGGWDLSTDKGFYYLLLLITVLVVVVITALTSGRLGRLLEAMADSPLALETHGATSSVLKVIVFCIAAAMASLAGALTGMLFHFSVGTYFPAFNSLTLVALVVIVTVGSPWYALIAAIGYSVIPAYITGENTSNVLTLLFGLAAATAAWGTRQGAMPAPVRRFFDRLGGRRRRRRAPARVGADRRRRCRVAVAPDGAAVGASAPPGPRGARPLGALRRRRRGRPRGPRGADGHDHRTHRAERRGQDDDVQRVQRSPQAELRTRPAARARRQP